MIERLLTILDSLFTPFKLIKNAYGKKRKYDFWKIFSNKTQANPFKYWSFTRYVTNDWGLANSIINAKVGSVNEKY